MHDSVSDVCLCRLLIQSQIRQGEASNSRICEQFRYKVSSVVLFARFTGNGGVNPHVKKILPACCPPGCYSAQACRRPTVAI